MEIQYFNTSYEDLEIDIIQVEWSDPGVVLESASYKDGVDLGLSGCTNPYNADASSCILSASIDTIMRYRSKDWLKLSFFPGKEPADLTSTIVVEGGATLMYEYGSL